jgi:TNF receptor-associated factor 2/TNF receptor-associated factor 3
LSHSKSQIQNAAPIADSFSAGAPDVGPNIFPDRAARRQVNKLVVKCSNSDNGCPWEGFLETHENEHILECAYKGQEGTFKCEVCNVKMSLEDWKIHGCLYKCNYCNLQVENKDKLKHLYISCEVAVQCVACNKKIYKDASCHEESNIATHLSDSAVAIQHIQILRDELQQYENDDIQHIPQILHDELQNDVIYDNLCHLLTQLEEQVKVNTDAIVNLDTNVPPPPSPIDPGTIFPPVQDSRPDLYKNRQDHQQMLMNQFHLHADHVRQLSIQLEQLQNELVHFVNDVGWIPTNAEGEEEETHLRRLEQLRAIKENKEEKIKLLKARVNEIEEKPIVDFQSQLEYQRITQMQARMTELQQDMELMQRKANDFSYYQSLLQTTYDGNFIWKIPNVKRKRDEAIKGKTLSLYSPPFYIGNNGYKVCMKVYLNGDGAGNNTHLSLFFVIMKGESDPFLAWPFEQKVTLMLMDQNHQSHIVYTFKPSSSSPSFQRPLHMNIASGFPKFASLGVLSNESFVQDDSMFIKCMVDTTGIVDQDP